MIIPLPYSSTARAQKASKLYYTVYRVDEVLDAAISLAKAFDGAIVM
jgi:hypothetical protein